MDSFELNKIFGAILGTLVFVMGIGFLAEAVYAPIEGRGATYELPEPEVGEGEEAEAEAEVEPIAVRMQSASADAGESLVNRCQSCHDYSSSNEDRTGPGLWEIVERPIAAHDGFGYSDALATLGSDGEDWTYENLDHFIESPSDFAPGTNMTFAGLSDPEDRANLIAFLREQADDPVALPEAEEQVEEEDGAEGESSDEEAADEDGEADAEPSGDAGSDAANEDDATEAEEEDGAAAEDAGDAADQDEDATQEAAPGDEASADGADGDLVALVDEVDPAAGESVAARCSSCHDLSEANANRVGPGLYDVFEREIGGHPDFAYSDALAELGEEGETWTIANLDAYIAGPSDFAPGTNMTFAGISDEEERAELIAYLRSLGD